MNKVFVDLILGEKSAKIGVIFVRLLPKQVTDIEYAQKIVDTVIKYENVLEDSLTIIKQNNVRCQNLDFDD